MSSQKALSVVVLVVFACGFALGHSSRRVVIVREVVHDTTTIYVRPPGSLVASDTFPPTWRTDAR